MRGLTGTSYAILGQLAQRPQTTYELAKWMQRNLRFFWPRAESGLYEEPKRLVRHRLLAAKQTQTGRRRSTRYEITSAGRKALRDWLGTTCAPPSLEFEGLLRVFLGRTGTTEQMAKNIGSARALADEIQAAGRVVAEEYLSRRAPFPERMHLSAVTFDFLWHVADLLRDWAWRSEAKVRRWPTASGPSRTTTARSVFRLARRDAASQDRDRAHRLPRRPRRTNIRSTSSSAS